MMLVMIPMGALFANDENNKETTDVSVTEKVDFSISRTMHDPATVPATDATAAPYNSLNLEIGLSKLRIFGYAQSIYYYNRTSGVDKNALEVQRVILMHRLHRA